ncbi:MULTISPECIES: 23S rRNA (pseudouridine(1915)-N(3))-methyltransferase RlmH [Chromohalobacter]|uniref:23S rRNA (pseudouridine(1915)-N(3))-methyltransferase RlmH n=1 Tax=Chromohalobacter TaxID=42054 RepID=UPI000A05FAF6|nr:MULTISPECIES: 23S rRNA (pseudouridine(1915)-N(3))-methyltransferase RlmH [Chromohalobacter]MBZ5877214.1 23S rRNA (pseudouridine(1915)-N(3))-methyltransferase RlmH [Chromohalobacter salexigens]MDF9433645.1 23S rRNA (pseudouridine(1915)-N(3))-methyltransferase RlmH [Chromohalobacter israelensis]MDO0944979.1 23S rRNA (pseudouridine(1915)-N(3))-methyltransferase RlmH [Chromohalobacter salexigens]NQY44496.1 23S rRNA (pseudouridine(1915)-N(3))-methyltransferase RlmH [Chromohalobacter sp.]NWO54677
MKLRVLAVGTRMPDWVTRGVDEYLKRLPRDFSVEIVEIAPGKRGKNADVARAIQGEGNAMLAKLRDQERVIALAVDGQHWSTERLAANADHWRQDGRDVALLVGGPDGLDPRLLSRAEQRWSLSALTLPHPLVRILLAEQLYRAWTLLAGHPYHR